VELGAPKEVYDQLNVPLTTVHTPQTVLNEMPDAGSVRLTVGKGRLGWEWVKGIALP
jgi:hypothetical protein